MNNMTRLLGAVPMHLWRAPSLRSSAVSLAMFFSNTKENVEFPQSVKSASRLPAPVLCVLCSLR